MKRVLSIDVFRGLTIFVMVFVNDVAGVSGLPAWMYHVPMGADGMTFVDIVFPAFLIIVGMSIPLATNRRIEKGESNLKIAQHVLLRTIGLIVLGLFMVNSQEMNKEANLIPAPVWTVLFYLSAIAVWNQYPSNPGSKKKIFRSVQVIGIIILLALPFFYRKGEPDALTGMTISWWGILGLIGWAYFISMLLYALTKDRLGWLIAALSLLLIITIGIMSPELELPTYLAWLSDQTGHLVHAILVLAGVIMSLMLRTGTGKVQMLWILVLGVSCFLVGYFLSPHYGVSKIAATPSWALYSIGWSSLVFLVIHWLVHIKNIIKWSNFLKPAGTNPLLTYILPSIFYAIFGFSYLPAAFNHGIPGVLRSILFSLFILWVAKVLTNKGIRLKL